MTKENRYLSFYQSILDNNLTKTLELSILTEQEVENYSEEYPHLNYNEIFKDNEPYYFLKSLLRTEEFIDFFEALDNTFNPLATEENIAIREANKLELTMHPLMNYCPNHVFRWLTVDALLSISYSSLLKENDVANNLINIMNQSPIIESILSVIAVSTTIDSSRPFSIALIDKNMYEYDPTSATDGYYNLIQNKLVVSNENSELNLDSLIHELAHKIIDILFPSRKGPYNSALTEDKYHYTIKNTLLNIQAFIKQNFDLDIVFENQNDTWQMGKTLSTILFPQYLEGDNIQAFISSFEQYNLDLNDEFTWLRGYTPLGLALTLQRFELANSLVEAGAIIKPIIPHVSAIYNNIDVLNWFLENASEIEINYKDCEGMTALAYASDPQIIKTLISAGAVAYPPNYQTICSIDSKCQNYGEVELTTTEKQLSALERLLELYNYEIYSKNVEDQEFIVRLPEIIAAGLYQDKIIDVLEPLAEYWQDIIYSAADTYQEQYNSSEICWDILHYADFLLTY